jgi:predicted chitinase
MPNAIAAIGCTLSCASTWAPHLNTVIGRWSIDTPVRATYFLVQIAVESGGLTRLEEGLSYSAERLMVVWSSRFSNARGSTAIRAQPSSSGEQRICRPHGQHAAWRWMALQGSSLKQLTDKTNYAAYLWLQESTA